MIEYKHGPLMAHSHLYEKMTGIAQTALDINREDVLIGYKKLGYRGCQVVLAYNQNELIGSTVWGQIDSFVQWGNFPELATKIKDRNHLIGHCNLFVDIHYWKTGVHRGLVSERYKKAFELGYKKALLFNTVSDPMLSFLLAQPGAKAIRGLKDENGRKVGLVDLKTFAKST